MSYLILGIAIVIGLILCSRWYINASPSTISRALKWFSLGIGALIIFGIIATKHLGWLAILIPALIPWMLRARQASRLAKNLHRMSEANSSSSGGSNSQTSEIETKYLRMFLLHETGEMNGDVVLGGFAGKTLMSLSFTDLISLMNEVQDDVNSRQVLHAYLARYHASEWQKYQDGQEEFRTNDLDLDEFSKAEALKVLGLPENASAEEVKEAHRRLISKLHPDHGGSNYLATMLNKAKEILLAD